MHDDSRNDQFPAAANPAPLPRIAASAARLPAVGHDLWRRTQFLAAAFVCSFGIATFLFLLRPLDINGQEPAKVAAPPAVFVGWPKPDLAIVVSGQQHGYLQKCGCSSPQLGGLTRRYNFLESLRGKGWPIVAVDIGEIANNHGPQAMLKYEYSMKALRLMDYSAVGLGKTEFNMPLNDALGRFALNNNSPAVLATNLADPNANFQTMGNQQFMKVNSVPQLGFFSVVDSKIEKEINAPGVKFVPAVKAMTDAFKANRASVNIVIYQGTDANDEVGAFIAQLNALQQKDPKGVPAVPIILCLGDPEPPGRPRIIGNTTVVSVGWKGRYVGVIGLFKNQGNAGYSMKYELVSMSDVYDTPPANINGHKLEKLMQNYADDVEKGNYIAKFPRGPHPIQIDLKTMGLPTNYVGSEKCASCHKEAFNIWAGTPMKPGTAHAVAFEALEKKAEHPSRRQFDGECVVCHTVGFQYTGGYLAPGNPPGFDELLKGVGCESCHGPGGAHVKNKDDLKVRGLINPYSTTHRLPEGPLALKAAHVAGQLRKQDDFCQKCHDQENDVHWDYQKAWPKIQHNSTAPAMVPVGK